MSMNDLIGDLSALGGLPFYLAAMITFLILQDYGTFWRLILGLVICYVIISAVRSIFIRDRPKPVQYRTWWEKIDAGTAISMHGMRAMVLAIILMDGFRNIGLSTFFIIIALVVASTRVILRKHYMADVVWGVALGAAVGLGIVYFV